MSTLSCHEVHKCFGSEVVLAGVSARIGPGDRIGLVGPNGAGKTTLLKVLAGLEVPDAGGVRRVPPDLTVGYLPQEGVGEPRETVLGYLRRRTGVAGAEAAVDRGAAELTSELSTAQAYSEALERFSRLGGDDIEARAGTVCAEVGLGEDALEARVDHLSGGQRARVALAAVLLSRFDIFLLDEPTNDLDFEGLERLEAFMTAVGAGVMVVSHDRTFLARHVGSVLELDGRSHATTSYGGGWQEYLRMRELERRRAEEAFEAYVRERGRLTEQAQRVKRWAEKGVAREIRNRDSLPRSAVDFRVNRTEKQASKVRSIERRLERMDEVPKPHDPWRLLLRLSPQARSGEVVVRLDDAVVNLGDFRLGPLSLELRWQERVGITGPNGCGKTTLLQALLGHLPLSAGRRYTGPGVVVGEMDQTREAYRSGAVLLQTFCRRSGELPEAARSLLAKFDLGPGDVDRPCDSLSPGERTRAVLAELMASGVNCLVLDEPTNHLDLPAIEELERALADYEGTIVVVTHDRTFLEALEVGRTVCLG